jgi:hypothetical protein
MIWRAFSLAREAGMAGPQRMDRCRQPFMCAPAPAALALRQVSAKGDIELRSFRESRPMRRAAAAFLAFLALSGCTREEARARLQGDIHADTIDIIHARFPCHSPDLHFFCYRFRVIEKGEYGDGDICWNMSTRQWTWRILPGQSLSRLNPRD